MKKLSQLDTIEDQSPYSEEMTVSYLFECLERGESAQEAQARFSHRQMNERCRENMKSQEFIYALSLAFRTAGNSSESLFRDVVTMSFHGSNVMTSDMRMRKESVIEVSSVGRQSLFSYLQCELGDGDLGELGGEDYVNIARGIEEYHLDLLMQDFFRK